LVTTILSRTSKGQIKTNILKDKMAYNNDGGFSRPKFQGNWTCGKCNAAITELPFQPDEARIKDLLCRDCHKAKRDSFGGNR